MDFKQFVAESVVTKQGVFMLNEGIDHIEALPPEEFIKAVEGIAEFTVSEKLDGANLTFGFEKDGKFYTSREAKGGDRKYSQDDYEDRAADNGFRSAHAALEKVKAQLATHVPKGGAVEVEVLFGRQPNAIVYGSNFIAFLRALPGDLEEIPNQNIVKELGDDLKGKRVTVTVPIKTTTDGIEIETKEVEQTWGFSSVSYIDSHHFADIDVKKEIDAFRKWLSTPNPAGGLGLTNNEILTVKLPSVPKPARPEVKAAREAAIKEANEKFKLPIKEKFLDGVLRVLQPALRDVKVDPHEDIGVEGVVLLNPKTLQQLKIVDKDLFTTINGFNHAIRNEIKAISRGRPEFAASLAREGDIFGNMLKKVANILGIPGLGEYISIKRIIKKSAGKDIEETLKNFTSEFAVQDVGALKSKINGALEEGLQELEEGLKDYHAQWQNYTHTLKTGKEVRYTQAIHERTLMVFAEVRQELKEMQQKVAAAETKADVAVALYGRQLKGIH